MYMNLYKDSHMPVYIRRTVHYRAEASKILWEVSKNSVKAVKFKEGMSVNENDWLYEAWNFYKPTNKYPDATSEQMFAGANTGENINESLFSSEMLLTGAKGINAVFDLGWAEYEMLGKGFICEYRLKNNGLHGRRYYGGSKNLKITYKRLR